MDRTPDLNAPPDACRDDCGFASAEADEIYQSIGRTRRSLDRSLDELQHRLTPRSIATRTMHSIKQTGTDMFKFTINTIKENPIPAAIAGAGVAWLVGCAMRERKAVRSSAVMDMECDVDPAYAGRSASSIADKARTVAHSAGEAVSSAAHTVKDTARDAVHTVKEKVSDVAGAVAEKTRDVMHTVDDRRRAVQRQVKKGYESGVHAAERSFQEYPILMGVSVFAAGLALAAAFPPSRKENELFGRTRDDLFDTVADRAKRAARSATDAAAERARRESLNNPSRLMSDVRETAGDSAADVGQEIGRRAGAVVGEALDAARQQIKPGRDDASKYGA